MSRDVLDGACRELLDQLLDKWSVLILDALCHGPLRFNQIRQALDGVTQKSLSQTLRRLERNGIVTRTVLGGHPVAVEYAITPMGRSLEEPFKTLQLWTSGHLAEVELARVDYDRREGLDD